MAGGGGMSSEVSGIERLRENLRRGGVRNPCLSSSVPWRNGAERKRCQDLGETSQFLNSSVASLCYRKSLIYCFWFFLNLYKSKQEVVKYDRGKDISWQVHLANYFTN